MSLAGFVSFAALAFLAFVGGLRIAAVLLRRLP